MSNGSNSNLVAVNLAPDEYIDMKLDIVLRGQVEAGEHTVYTRIIEEGVDIDDARYFDLPVKIVIQEEVIPNRIGNHRQERAVSVLSKRRTEEFGISTSATKTTFRWTWLFGSTNHKDGTERYGQRPANWVAIS